MGVWSASASCVARRSPGREARSHRHPQLAHGRRDRAAGRACRCGDDRPDGARRVDHGRLAADADVVDLTDGDLEDLWEELLDLPRVDISLLVELPKLIAPDLRRLREAIADGDPDWGRDALTAVAAQIDTPSKRAQLADALVRLRDQRRITDRQAAAAIIDLASRSTRFIGASLLQAVALSVGATRTPGGLEIAA